MSDPQSEYDRLFDADDEFTPTEEPELTEEAPADPEPAEPEFEPEEAPADPDPEPEAAPEDPEPEVDYKALYEKEQQRLKSFEGRYKKEKEQWESKGRKPMMEEPAADTDEDAFLEKFKTEYNEEVVKAVELISTRKAQELLNSFRQQAVDPLLEEHTRAAQEAHIAKIAATHNDWDAIVESSHFNTWVDEQPAFMKRAYQQVLEAGTTADVIDMLSAYKSATKPAHHQVDPVKKQQAAAVKPTRGGVSARTTQPKSQDFDSLWDEIDD